MSVKEDSTSMTKTLGSNLGLVYIVDSQVDAVSKTRSLVLSHPSASSKGCNFELP